MQRLLQRLLLALIVLGAPFKIYGGYQELTKSINHNGMFLFYLIDKSNNSLISPLSINASLLMTYMGAKGKTAHEIASALHLKIPQDQVASAYSSLSNRLTEEGSSLVINNSLWVGKKFPILSSYESLVEEIFNGSIHKVDFTKGKLAAEKINEWVFNTSQQSTAPFITPAMIPPSTKMILLNNLTLKGSWGIPFKTENTEQETFHTGDGKKVFCEMMNQSGEFYYFEDGETQIISLPIDNLNSHLAFIAFLPKKETQDIYNFYYAQDENKPEGFLSYLANLRKKTVNLSLPKFSTSQKLDLLPLYRALGIQTALTNHADFSGINGKKDLMISQAYEQSTLSIDEGGIFASSSGGTSFSLKSTRGNRGIPMVLNHPFLYIIYDFDTNLLLFIGECQDPTSGGQPS
ncbi:MAG: hypothetical protein KDK76_07670 [Chlamydiia bacterium]|nr:hypothetical protein [Chlamydiia bacterium]